MNLKTLCREHNYTFTKLSKETNISVTYLSKLSHGVYTNPTWGVIAKIASVLKVSPIEVGNAISEE